MKKTIRGIFFAVALVAGIAFFNADAEAKSLNLKEIVEKTLGNSVRPTITGKKIQVSDKKLAKLKKGAKRVKGKKALIKEFRKNVLKRKKKFSITTKDYFSSNVNSDTFYYGIFNIDDKKTSDDSDFAFGGITYLAYEWYMSPNGDEVLKFKNSYTETSAQVKKVNKKAKSVLKKLNVSGMSDVAKVKTIHDYVIDLVTYDDSMKDHSAYGGLVASKHSTVCQGYALIMYKLLTDAGVPCHYVTGDAGGPHAWNMVKINKKWYYLDATWDDPSDSLVYDYFLVGSKTFKKDHKTDEFYTKKFKFSSEDLDWEKLLEDSDNKNDKDVPIEQTDEEKENGEKALERQDFIHQLNDTIDQLLNESEAPEDYEIALYDVCKKIFGFVIEGLSDEAFAMLVSDDMMLDTFTGDTLELIDYYIVNPITDYLDSDEFAEDTVNLLIKDFGEDLYEHLEDDEIGNLLDGYVYDAVTNMLYAQTEEYSSTIVSTMVDELNGMV